MNKLYDIDDLIAKVLADEATPDEARELQERLAGSAELRHYYEQMRRLWDASEDALTDLEVNTDVAWEKVQTRINAPKSEVKPLTVSWLQPRQLLRLAAVGAILVAAGLWFFRDSGEKPPIQIAAQNAAIEQKMEDGSEVKISEQSKLTAVFSDKERRVKLEGKAFFKVAPDTTKPFIIETQSLEVKVVGTQFTVDDRSQAGKVIVLVTEGKVLLRGGFEEKLLLAGTKAEYIVATKRINVAENVVLNEPNLDYKGVLLKKVASDLSSYFGVKIEVGAVVAGCKVKASYSGVVLTKILNNLEDLGYTISGNETDGYKITGDDCY